MKPAPAPRWFWLLPLLAVAAWWPIGPAWQSDDYFAIHYVQDGDNVLHDFVGQQYGVVGFWIFHRPLITVSFWFEQCLGGTNPFWSHLGNVLAHGVSAYLAARVWRHFVPNGAAFAAGLVWAMAPSHIGAIAWTVGRVDSYSTPWILLCLLLALRAQAARAHGEVARTWPAVVAMVMALFCKENALVLPLLAMFLCAGTAAGTWPLRMRTAARTTAPLWILLVAWLPLRLLLLGKLGGYDGDAIAPLAMLRGLGTTLAHLAAPWRWVASTPDTPYWLSLASGMLPTVVALGLALRSNARVVLGGAVAAAIALLPTATMLVHAHNPQVLRYCYVPLLGLGAIAAAGGRIATIALLVAAVPPFVAMRVVQHEADRESNTYHAAILAEAQRNPPAPMVVVGLPNMNRNGTVIQMHFAVDRLTAPPFVTDPIPLCAHRPLTNAPGAFRLDPPGRETALPFGSTFVLRDGIAVLAPAAPTLPELRVEGVLDALGVVDLTTPQLDRLLADPDLRPTLRTPDVQPMAYRLTLFTAGGYLATQFLDHGGGSIDLRRWFTNESLYGGLTGLEGPWLGDAMRLPTVVDLALDFPAMLEAGTVDLGTGAFTATHRCSRRLVFRFDRGYNAWADRAQGR